MQVTTKKSCITPSAEEQRQPEGQHRQPDRRPLQRAGVEPVLRPRRPEAPDLQVLHDRSRRPQCSPGVVTLIKRSSSSSLSVFSPKYISG
jgi:hypothetical protein